MRHWRLATAQLRSGGVELRRGGTQRRHGSVPHAPHRVRLQDAMLFSLEGGLAVGEVPLKAQPQNEHWVDTCFGPEVMAELADAPISCAGRRVGGWVPMGSVPPAAPAARCCCRAGCRREAARLPCPRLPAPHCTRITHILATHATHTTHTPDPRRRRHRGQRVGHVQLRHAAAQGGLRHRPLQVQARRGVGRRGATWACRGGLACEAWLRRQLCRHCRQPSPCVLGACGLVCLWYRRYYGSDQAVHNYLLHYLGPRGNLTFPYHVRRNWDSPVHTAGARPAAGGRWCWAGLGAAGVGACSCV